jgi:hypothetical protein
MTRPLVWPRQDYGSCVNVTPVASRYKLRLFFTSAVIRQYFRRIYQHHPKPGTRLKWTTQILLSRSSLPNVPAPSGLGMSTLYHLDRVFTT